MVQNFGDQTRTYQLLC